jgi:3-mercaptopyruvate sulfurtransferase SseA
MAIHVCARVAPGKQRFELSTLAAATLREMGFTSAIALDGSWRDWVEAGGPVEKGASAQP